MKRSTRKQGIRVSHPDNFRISTGRSRARGMRSAFGTNVLPESQQTQDLESEEIVQLLSGEMEKVDEFVVEPVAERPARRRARAEAEADERITVEVDVAADESAVVLVEQDGVYSWCLPTTSQMVEQESDRRGRRGRRDAAKTYKSLEIDLNMQGVTKTRRGRSSRGLIGDFVVGRIKAYVLKFAARLVVGGTMRFLERNVRPGLLWFKSEDVKDWEPVSDLSVFDFEQDADYVPRILLFVHGTFSSTVNGFGGISANGPCREFLKDAIERYDVVIGYDHATLSLNPLENATDLLRLLETGAWPNPPVIDAIAHSRGGLVLRSLIEFLGTESDIKFDRAVFVGCTNGGTTLAEPDNWQAMIDMYTNLAVAASRAIALLPAAPAVGVLLGPVVEKIGIFAKYIVNTAVTDQAVPGLAAMEPDGSFVRLINETQPGQPTADEISYYAVTSNFDRSIFERTPPREIPKHLVGVLADRVTDQLLGSDNDLVVNVSSMTAIDPQGQDYVKGVFDFGSNGIVYHTVYFLQPILAAYLRDWLSVPGATRARGDVFRAGIDNVSRGPLHELAVSAVWGPSKPIKKTDKGVEWTKLKIIVEWGDIAQSKGDVLAAGHYVGVEPQNAELALDYLVSGKKWGKQDEKPFVLTQQTKRGMLRGGLGEIALFPVPRRNKRESQQFVAVCGMGYQGDFDELQLKTIYRNLAWKLGMIPGVQKLSTVLIGGGEGGLPFENVLNEMANGYVEAMRGGGIGSSTLKEVRIVEFDKARAIEILDCFKSLAEKWTDAIDIESILATGRGGKTGDAHLLSTLLGTAAEAAASRADSADRKAFERLVAKMPVDKDDQQRTLKLLRKMTDADAEQPENQSWLPKVWIPSEANAGSANDVSTRISFFTDNRIIRAAAISRSAAITERVISVSPELLTEAATRMTDPNYDDVRDLGDILLRLVIPRDFRKLLKQANPLVFELDRNTAYLHWEMLLNKFAEEDGRPLGLVRQVSRQIRTQYSPPPSSDRIRKGRPRALVIGDPGDPDLGHDLPGARREALKVSRLLREKDIEVTQLIGAPGTEPIGQAGDGPASRFDALAHLMRGDYDIVHYAGHGDFDPENPDRVGWLFQDGMLTAGEIRRIDRAPVVIVANACLSGRVSEVAAGGEYSNSRNEVALLPTLADEFFRRGVRNYIGTAWEVDDEGAIRFAETFYDAFIQRGGDQPEGDKLGDAMLKARKLLASKQRDYHALWAAYQHYGDVNFSLGDL